MRVQRDTLSAHWARSLVQNPTFVCDAMCAEEQQLKECKHKKEKIRTSGAVRRCAQRQTAHSTVSPEAAAVRSALAAADDRVRWEEAEKGSRSKKITRRRG